jgi:hypothetical protein
MRGGIAKTVAILATFLKFPRKMHFFEQEDRQLPSVKKPRQTSLTIVSDRHDATEPYFVLATLS